MLESPVIRSFRELLQISPGALPEELKRAYRSLAKVYHPDQNADPGAAVVFMRIKEAYRTLSDPVSVKKLNNAYAAGERLKPCVDGLDLNLGSFFGHRFTGVVRAAAPGDSLVPEEDRPRWHIDAAGNPRFTAEAGTESEISILDDPVLDLMEVIFAGRITGEDEFQLYSAFRKKDFSELPWYVLNNQGVASFLDGRYEVALDCYTTLNIRIPNNIVFLYRLGICHEIMAFQKRYRNILGKEVAHRGHVGAAIQCFERAVRLGESRMDLPQKCMTIRKVLADLLSITGRRWRAYRAWSLICDIQPTCREAQFKLEKARPRLLPAFKGG